MNLLLPKSQSTRLGLRVRTAFSRLKNYLYYTYNSPTHKLMPFVLIVTYTYKKKKKPHQKKPQQLSREGGGKIC